MYGCESWMTKKAERRRINAFELQCWRRLKSPLDCEEIKAVNPKGNQSWILTGRTDTEAEAPILCPPDAKNWLLGKDPDAGKDWRQEEKGTKENEMVGWHHQLNEHEFEQAPGVGDGHGSLECCSPRGRKESGMTEWLNWTCTMGVHVSRGYTLSVRVPHSHMVFVMLHEHRILVDPQSVAIQQDPGKCILSTPE